MNPRKTTGLSIQSWEVGCLEQSMSSATETPWPLDPSLALPFSGVHPRFLLVLVPVLPPGPCFSCPHFGEAPPKPSQMYSPWGRRGVCRVLSPTASTGAGGVSRDPNTWLWGGAAPCAGSRRGTVSDWHVPPPGTPARVGGEGGREREGGREGRKGREGELEGSLRQRLSLDQVLERGPLLEQGTQFQAQEGGSQR